MAGLVEVDRTARRLRRATRIASLAAGLALTASAAKCPGGGAATPAPIRSVGAKGDSAQQVLYGPSMILAQGSVARARLGAQSARVFGGGTRIELEGITLTFVDSGGVNGALLGVGTLTAREGTYTPASSRLDARGSVKIVRTDGRRLESEHVVLDYGRSTITADGAFTYADGASSPRVTGTGFESDARLRRASPARKARGAAPAR